MLSSPGADSQLMVPHVAQVPRSIPSFCQWKANDSYGVEGAKLRELLQVPDLQILLYGG